MELTGVVQDLESPQQLLSERPQWPGALSIDDLEPFMRVTVITVALPSGAAEFTARTAADGDSQPLSREMRQDLVLLDLPFFRRRTRKGYFVRALARNVERYPHIHETHQQPSAQDVQIVDLATMGITPYAHLATGNEELWNARVYTIRTSPPPTVSRVMPPPFFEEEDGPVG
jgi:hypothetical protein